MFKKLLQITCFFAVLSTYSQVVINEIDADTPGTDTKEFIELKSVTANFSLDGYVLVFLNGGSTGTSNASYLALDLDGYTTDINGLFLIGNNQVSPTPTYIIPNASIQNGPDVVALYQANASDFPLNTIGTSSNLIDAVAYSSSTSSSPTAIMSALGITTFGIDNTNSSANTSIQRNNDGTYTSATPTPGQNNDGSGVVLNHVTITASATTVNEGDTIVFTFTTETPVVGSNLIINMVVNNGTFNLQDINGTLTTFIPVGQTSISNSLLIVNDGTNEGDEELLLNVQSLQPGFVLNNNYLLIRINESNFEVKPWGTPANPTYGVVAPTYPAGYYSSLEGLSGAALKQALQNIIANPQVVRAHTYADIWEILKTADQNPENSSQVWLIYNETPRSKLDQQATSSIVGKWNREHIYCQSRGNFGDWYDTSATGINNYVLSNASDIAAGLSDAHHLRAADGQENSSRGNRNYGVDYNGPTGNPGSWKGDVARALFYMAVRYNGLNVVNGNPVDNTIGQIGDLTTLLSWNQQDTSDDFEMNRNNYIYTWQMNRNPFIDYPSLVNYVFGANYGQPWFSSLATTEINFDKIVLYPNPVNDYLSITGLNTKGTLELFNTLGEKVFQSDIENQHQINLNLQSGVYFAKISSENKNFTKKIIITN
ncbi:MAG: endonuclease [Bacteroidetes bacterium]|uniref:endonuclease n=1 Tax=Flavobacterium sp. TaxID=239 RepID=UPI002FD96034|nr:endonuclease [Bacteroidota bacterium]